MLKNFIVLVLFIVLNINEYSNGQQQQGRIISNSKFNKLDSSKPYSAIEGFLINQKPLGNLFVLFFSRSTVIL
jgi:hypothetical protein